MTATRIKKLEHSSFILEHKSNRIAFDPGVFSVLNENLHNVDILILTHKHGDHLIIDNVNYVAENSNNLKIITNSEVAEQLKDLGLNVQIVEGNESITINDIKITAQDEKHEEIYGEFNMVQNTGYYVDDVFFHPGDTFTNPKKTVKAVATVIIAPFMRVKMAINYINNNPNLIHFGVHDSVAQIEVRGWLEKMINANIDKEIRYEHPGSENEFVTL